MEDFDDMEDSYEVISAIDENGQEKSYFIIDVAQSNDTQYLLVVEEELFDSDDVEAIILKQTTNDGDDSIFSELKDEDEIAQIAELFSDSDDYELEI